MGTLADIAREGIRAVTEQTNIVGLVGEAYDLLRTEVARSSGIVEVPSNIRLLAVGDIHGDLETLLKILERATLTSINKGDVKVVFLGDYIDRGPYQLESLMSVLVLKKRFPDSIVTLRGNHEPPEDLIPYPHDFPLELVMRFGYAKGNDLYRLFLRLFNVLPHVALVKGELVLLHGGLPTRTYKRASTVYEYFNGLEESTRSEILAEVLWNDPVEYNVVSMPSPRGAGYLFGSKVTSWFLKKFKVKVVIRGHEPADKGYKFNHNNTVLTLFSRLGPPYYNSSAAYALIDLSQERWSRNIVNYIRLIS